MLDAFRAALVIYINSRWARWILAISAILIFAASYGFWAMLGFGSESGTGSGGKVITFLTLVVAVPAVILFNAALAVAWAFVRAIAHAASR